jgi:hypothetical protein
MRQQFSTLRRLALAIAVGAIALAGPALAQDQHGNTFELDAEGLLAVCVQHEMDHLEGKVFVEYLSPLKRARLSAKLRKKQRLAG